MLRFAVAAFVAHGVALSQPTIYAVGFGETSADALYRVSSVTGAATVVGPITGFLDVNAADFDPRGVLYAYGLNIFLNPFLVTIDPATGAASQVALITGVPLLFEASDFAFRSDGVLFAIFGEALYTVNTSTGTTMLVGVPNALAPAALAFSPEGTLYLADRNDFYTVDPLTAATTIVAHLSYDPSFGANPQPNAMTFDPKSGVLYVTISSNEGSSLGIINAATGAVSRVGASVPGLRAIAIPRLSRPLVVPAPSTLLLLCTGLFIIAVWMRRRALRA